MGWPTTPPTHRNCEGPTRQYKKLIFGMQLYFDQTRTTTSKKYMEYTLNKNKNDDDLKNPPSIPSFTEGVVLGFSNVTWAPI
jgi:hypothetical protein